MPTYSYVCSKCGHTFDHFHKSLKKLDDVRCPKCGGVVERKWGGVNWSIKIK